MLRSLLFLLVLVTPCATIAEVIRLSEPVESGAGYEVFGAPMSNKNAAPSLGEVIANAESHADQTVRVSTTIAQVCQKKGCFFIAVDGDQWARVTFRDYEFFVPTDSMSKAVTLEGVFSERQLSAEEVAHYEADLGKADGGPSVPRVEYSIVATSVMILSDV
ncbi:MAG: DUF4920 domain-containing protein [Pseudomonadota bacterium]